MTAAGGTAAGVTPLTPRARVWSDRHLAVRTEGGLPSRTVPNTESSVDLAQIFEPIRSDLDRVEQEYASQIQSRVDVIPQIGKYLQNGGGKRIRPALVLMCSEACGVSLAAPVTTSTSRETLGSKLPVVVSKVTW